MSEYENRYDDQEDETNYAPYIVAALGGAGGRLIGGKLAGKAGKVKIKGKKGKGGGKSAGELRSDRFANIGTGAGAASGYALGGLATGDESVRQTLDRVIEARDAVRDAGEQVASPTGRQIASDALRYGGALTMWAGIPAAYRIMRKNARHIQRGTRPKTDTDLKRGLKTAGKYGAAGAAMGATGIAIQPEQRQPYSAYDLLPNPYMDSYQPDYNRRR